MAEENCFEKMGEVCTFLNDEKITKFRSNVSHELRTPLVSIYSASDLLLNAYSDIMNDEMIDLVEIIKDGGARMNIVIEELLNALE